ESWQDINKNTMYIKSPYIIYGPIRNIASTIHRVSTFTMPPIRHRHPLTDIEKGEIIVLCKNISHIKISEELHIPRRTISNFLQRFKNRHSPYNLLHS